MSLILTESFSLFKRFTGTDTQALVAAEQLKQQTTLAKGGYTYTYLTSTAGWVVRDDPLDPAGACLAFTPATSTTGSTATPARLTIPLPVQPFSIILGFSLYIPAEFVPSVGTGVIFSLSAGSAQTAMLQVRQSLQVANGADLQSPRTLTPGRLNYLEVRISPAGYQFWVDDALMYESTVQLPKESITLAMFRLPGLVAETLKWTVGNVYLLSQDSIAPNVRLGPTTRVIASTPSVDVDVEFIRPQSAPSNAAVVAQTIDEANPLLTLQAENVGARDEYGFATNPAISGAALIHGITTKVIAANLESAKHSLRPFVSGGDVDGADENYYSCDMVQASDARPLKAACVREDGTMFVCGTGPSVWYSTDDGDTWQLGYDGGTAVIANDIACGPDGTVIACCNGGQFLTCQGTDGPTTWTFAMSPASGFNLTCIAVSPAGTWICGHLGGNAQQLVKFGAAAWALQTRLNAAWCAYIGGAFYFNTSAISASRSVDATAWSAMAPVPPNGAGDKFPMVVRNGVLSRYYTKSVSRVTTYRYTGAAWVLEYVETMAGTAATVQNIAGAVHDPVNDIVLILAPGIFSLIPAGQTLMAVNVRPPSPNFLSLAYGNPCVTRKGFLVPIDAASGVDSGKVVLFRRRRSARPIVMSDGYALFSNSASVDPDTGLPWTAADANASTGGMTVIS